MPPAIQTRIHEGQNGNLPDLRDAWRDCLAACPPEQQLFTFDWFDTWSRTYGVLPPWTGRTCVITAHDASGAPCALLPLIERRAHGITYLSLAGFYQPLRSFPSVPALADAAGAAIARALLHDLQGWDVLRFGPWDEAAPERGGLINAFAAQARYRVVITRGRTIVNLITPTTAVYAGSKTIKRIEEYTRRFAREPGAEIRHISNPDCAVAAAMFRDLGTIEEHSWLAREGGDMRFVTETDKAFWQRVTELTLTPGRNLNVWLAYWKGKPVAFLVCLSSGSVDFVIANQFDEEAGQFRLGSILGLRHLRFAVEHGRRIIDSAPGDLHYKGRLGGQEAEMRQDLFVFRNSSKGWMLKQLLNNLHATKKYLGSKPWGRRLAAHMPRV